MKKFGVFMLLIAIIAAGVFYFQRDALHAEKKDQDHKLVSVTRGDIVEKALAIGKIEPKKEIAVKSKISGIISKIHVEVGDVVKPGQPLFEISPNPTPFEFAEISMAVELADVDYSNARKTHERNIQLFRQNLIPQENLETSELSMNQTQLRLKLAREKMNLLQKGKAKVAEQNIENVIYSPVAGMVLERKVNEGDPIVPLTSYQAGTELLLLADMNNLIFKGSVDEIDVGKLYEGMPAKITLGALPEAEVSGTISLISPKAKVENSATTFDTEIRIKRVNNIMLRAGYSANADIIIKEKKDALLIPERLVIFRNDSAFVKLPGATEPVETFVALGISDGIQVEVLEGLQDGDSLIEPPAKTIN